MVFVWIGAFLVSIVSTVSGGGASLLYMPLIALTVGVKAVAPTLTLGISLGSLARVFFFWKFIDWNLFFWLFPSTIIGSVLGSVLFAELSADYLQAVIGLFLLTSIFQLRLRNSEVKTRFQIKAWHFAPIGFFVAFISGLTGGGGPLMNTAYLNYGMPKESMIGTRSANAIVLHFCKLVSYGILGYLTQEVLLFGLLIGSSAILGNYTGKIFLSRISELSFRNIVVFSTFGSGVYLLIKNKNFILSYLEYIVKVGIIN